MSGPIVVGHPRGAGMEAARALSAVMPSGTLVWSDGELLRDVSDEVADLGWDVLVVRGDDEGFSTAAMSFRAQVHGTPPVIVLAIGEASMQEGAEAIALATMVARHLDPLPVIVVGDPAPWLPIAADLELDPPVVASLAELAGVLDELVDVSSLDRRSNG